MVKNLVLNHSPEVCMVNIISSSRYKIDRKKIKRFVEEYLREKGFVLDYIINIVFIGRIKMRQLAKKYKKEDVALPVLSFPYQFEKIEGNKMIGEVFICFPQAVLLAAEREKKVDDIIIYLIKHGIENLIQQ